MQTAQWYLDVNKAETLFNNTTMQIEAYQHQARSTASLGLCSRCTLNPVMTQNEHSQTIRRQILELTRAYSRLVHRQNRPAGDGLTPEFIQE